MKSLGKHPDTSMLFANSPQLGGNWSTLFLGSKHFDGTWSLIGCKNPQPRRRRRGLGRSHDSWAFLALRLGEQICWGIETPSWHLMTNCWRHFYGFLSCTESAAARANGDRTIQWEHPDDTHQLEMTQGTALQAFHLRWSICKNVRPAAVSKQLLFFNTSTVISSMVGKWSISFDCVPTCPLGIQYFSAST